PGSYYSQPTTVHRTQCLGTAECLAYIFEEGRFSFTPTTEDGKPLPAQKPTAATGATATKERKSLAAAGRFNRRRPWRHKRTMRLSIAIVSLSFGSLAFTQGCSSSPPSAGLWSCFDTGTQTACTQVSALSTADQDVNGDGIPDHFVCADDDNDGHNRGRDDDQSGLRSGSGHDEDND